MVQKKSKLIYLIFCVLAVFLLIGIVKISYQSLKRYETAEAVGLAEYRAVIDVYEEYDTAVLACDNNGGVNYMFAEKNKKGWKECSGSKIIYNQSPWYVELGKTDHSYILFIMNNFEETVPTDNFKNQFHCFSYRVKTKKDGEITLQRWSLILDEIPEDYILFLSDVEVPIKPYR